MGSDSNLIHNYKNLKWQSGGELKSMAYPGHNGIISRWVEGVNAVKIGDQGTMLYNGGGLIPTQIVEFKKGIPFKFSVYDQQDGFDRFLNLYDNKNYRESLTKIKYEPKAVFHLKDKKQWSYFKEEQNGKCIANKVYEIVENSSTCVTSKKPFLASSRNDMHHLKSFLEMIGLLSMPLMIRHNLETDRRMNYRTNNAIKKINLDV